RESLRRVFLDLAWLLLGGLLAGGLGVAWIVGNGAWPYFREVFLDWNPNYVSNVFDEAGDRFFYTFEVFRPWGLLHNIAIPLALLALWEGRIFSRRAGNPKSMRRLKWVYSCADTETIANARMLLAMLYLGWLIQVILFQKGFEYAQVPVLLLGLAVIATHRWTLGFLYLLWFVFLGLLLNFTSLVSPAENPAPGVPAIRLEHYGPLTDPNTLKLWPRCWREGSSPELRDRLGVYINIHCGVNWKELRDVATFLRTLDPPLRNGELNCWHDSTHSLYLTLDLDPATRYMHFGTVFSIPSKDDWIKKRIAEEVRASRQRYVVADLARLAQDRAKPHQPGPGGVRQKLPPWFPDSAKDKFPWNQELVFRSGRYVVYQVVNDLGEIDVPDWPPAVEPEAAR
ncbi:MAG: hypothetical protein K8U57_24850, partial [Planctomycetes bacterium]|nr:hypothetical protein [Planctomycetota bacterium]